MMQRERICNWHYLLSGTLFSGKSKKSIFQQIFSRFSNFIAYFWLEGYCLENGRQNGGVKYLRV